MKRFIVVLVLMGLIGGAVSAQVFDFTLVNETGFTIDEVYVSPSIDEKWGEDVLELEVLADGEFVEIKFDAEYELFLLAFNIDTYDLMVIDEDGDEYIWEDLKLEEITEIAISLDKKGNGIAEIK